MTVKPSEPVMTDEQRALFDVLKPLQREIALNSLSGMNDIDAYRASNGKATTEESMRASVSQILTNLNVRRFLDSIKESAVSDAVMSRQEMMERQTKIINIDADSLDEMSLEQLTELKGGLEIQLKAMKQLADLAGYNSAQKIEHTVISNADDEDW